MKLTDRQQEVTEDDGNERFESVLSDSERTFPIGIQSRLKHGDLIRAAQSLGSQSALARHLGLSPVQVGEWCNLQRCPPTSVEEIHPSSHWTAETLAELERKLFGLTGKTLDELFPRELRHNREFLRAPKQRLAIQDMELQAIASAANTRLTLPSPEEMLEKQEQYEAVHKALRFLSSAERKIVELRYGIGGDGRTHTLTEVASIFSIGKERVRNIESRALCRLQLHRPELCDVVPDAWNAFDADGTSAHAPGGAAQESKGNGDIAH